jgi:low affinity Fe/Cu permease
VDELASRPLTVLLVVGGAVTWIGVSLAAGFPARWETGFQTVVAALTLSMVFVIQHTQARHQRAAQRKLDEILATMPGTDNTLLTLEHAADEEMHATGHQHGKIRQAALADRGSADRERPES